MSIREINHPVQIVDGARVQVIELIWADDRRSFDVYVEVEAGILDCLTLDESFDTYPTTAQISDLLTSYQA